MNSFPTIKQLHKKAIAQERIITKHLFNAYRKLGVITGSITNEELKSIIKQSQILYAYWLMDAELSGISSDEQKVRCYAEICLAPLLPFLTETAKIEYKNYVKNMNK